jgi:hypothetical protein
LRRDRADYDDAADDDVDRPARRGSRLAWAAGILLVLLLAGGGTYWQWGVNAQRALDEAVSELRRNGQPVEAADLAAPPIAGADNAAIDLRAAAQLLDTSSDPWKAFEAVDPTEPLSEEAQRKVVAVVESEGARKALALVREARGKRAADWQIPMQSPLLSVLLPDLGEQRKLANVARAAARQARLRGDHAAAVEYARDLMGIARAIDFQSLLISHLVAAGIGESAVYELEQLAPDLEVSGRAARRPAETKVARPATPDQVRLLIADLLDEAPANQALRQAFRTERVMQLDTAALVADRKLPLSTVSGTSGGGKGAGIDHLPRALILSDARLMLDHTTATLAVLEKSADWPSYQKNAPASPLPDKGASARHFVAGLLLPAYENAVRTHFRSLADRRLAAAALAVRCYAADHGRLPQKLDELVPQYLPSVPLDPFAAGGKPLRYVAAPVPLVYSVGDNGTDEGGSDQRVNPKRQVMSRWDTQDAVFFAAPKPPPAPPVAPRPPE